MSHKITARDNDEENISSDCKKKSKNSNLPIIFQMYIISRKRILSRYVFRRKKRHVNLLYIEDNNIGYFVWFKNLSRLVSSQLNKNDHRKYICDRQSHTVDCREINDCAIRLPSDKDKWLMFNNYNRKEWLSFVMYALECILKKTEKEKTSPSI
ncbi:hypothetical protein ACFW04_014120 [Cataglyphis niger]